LDGRGLVHYLVKERVVESGREPPQLVLGDGGLHLVVDVGADLPDTGERLVLQGDAVGMPLGGLFQGTLQERFGGGRGRRGATLGYL
jgi:hypothetical protein